jgi:long-subunit acyl-CoA synthetase (AMP-forming)
LKAIANIDVPLPGPICSSKLEHLAAGFVALGLNEGDRAAICAENSTEWLIVLHATLIAGASAMSVTTTEADRD